MTGLLLCVGAPLASLGGHRQAGRRRARARGRLHRLHRRRPPPQTDHAAAEVQQHLLPPRIARIAGAQLAGTLLPTYEVGGDWFDFVENRDGAWLAIADAPGNGPTAAGLGAAALGALRAARRSGQDLEHALRTRCTRPFATSATAEFHITALVARWRAPTATLTWVNCGHPAAYLVDTEGNLQRTGRPRASAARRPGIRDSLHAWPSLQLHSGERLILVTNGIVNRRVEGGGRFGIEGLEPRARARARVRPRHATAIAIQKAVSDCWREPLEDDATVVVMAIE